MVWLAHWPRQHTVKLGLDRMRAFLAALGNPHENMPPVIHVAGTNGKGSTVAFIRSLLEAYGCTVHVNTSPHIERFNERIVIAGQEITDQHLYSLSEEGRLVADKHGLDPSFFEGITAAAFLAFSRTKADFTIVETGLGGELDATNVVKNPLITVITPISLDHTDILGDTIEKISVTKAGIIKERVPCVVSMQPDDVLDIIKRAASAKNAPLYSFEYDYGIDLKENHWVYKAPDIEFELQHPSLKGDHQYINASAAITTVLQIPQLKFTESIVNRGVTSAKWKGRLQEIEHGRLVKLLPEKSRIIVDAAHNEAGAQVLSHWLRNEPKMPTYLIFCMTRNRDVNKFLSFFEGLIDQIISVPIFSEPSSYKAQDIIDLLQIQTFKGKISPQGNVDDAITHILNTTNTPVRVLITGSMYLISDFLLANAR